MTLATCPWCGSDDLDPVFDDPADRDAFEEAAVPDDDGVFPWPARASTAHCRACGHDWSPTPASVELVVDDEERLDWIENATHLDADTITAVLALEARQAHIHGTDGTGRPATVDLGTLAGDAERFLGVPHLDAFAVLDAETGYLDHLRAHPRIPGLPYDRWVLTIATADDLRTVLDVPPGTDLSRRSVDIGPRDWSRTDPRDRAATCAALAGAVERLCAAGLLPPPVDPLPALGTRVEVIGRPSTSPHVRVPARGFATGVVTQQHWSAGVGGCTPHWELRVHLDEPAGTFRGHPVGVTWVHAWEVHVIGGPGRPRSTMTPGEIHQRSWDRQAQHRPRHTRR